jgi:hypothetical protein
VFNFEQGRCSKRYSGDRTHGPEKRTFVAGKGSPDQGSPRVNRQGLREQYDPLQPFSNRLAELVGKIERSTKERNAKDASRGRVLARRETYRTDVSHQVIRGKAMSPADYRRRAEELVSIADRVGDYRSRAALLAMAQSWQHLAAQAEKNLQTVLVYATPEPR